MKKIIGMNKIQRTVIIIACIGFFGILIYIKIKSDLPLFMKEDVTISETITNDGKQVIMLEDIDEAAAKKLFPVSMTEAEVGIAIHHMSHQKVKADDKWGYMPLSMNRVVRLIDVIEANKDKYKNDGIYLGILSRWQKHNFSSVHYDHNAVWQIQGGTIGKATGVLMAHEEMEYIEEYYDFNE